MSVVRHAYDRQCTHVDDEGEQCITVLCYLNPGPECWHHAAQARRPRRERPGEVHRLMRQDDARVAA